MRSLASEARSISEIAAPFRMSFAAASKHVKVLEKAGLIARTVQGRTHMCRLDAARLAEAQRWIGFYERFWADRLGVLEELLRQPEDEASPDAAEHTRKAKGDDHE